jgi:Tol biopolymer transport system component
MNENQPTGQPAPDPFPISASTPKPVKPTRHSRWRTFAILSGSIVGVMALIALTLYILGSRGMLSGATRHVNEEPAWSPDGSKIAFTSDRGGNYDIYVMSSNGTNIQQLTSNPFASLLLNPGNAADFAPAWSPDGKRIAFVSGRNNSSLSFVDTDIFIMNADGQNVSQWKGSRPYAADKYPEWSPDGCCIIFASSPNTAAGETGNSNIYWASTDSGNPANLTNLTLLEAVDSDPSWSPDGKRVAFSSFKDDNWHIYTMNKNGSGLVQLTFGEGSESEISPIWSPDGAHIAYTGVLGIRADIYVIDTDGSNKVKLTSGPANAFLPAWSPDSRRIAFVSSLNGVENISMMNADGTNVVQLTK